MVEKEEMFTTESAAAWAGWTVTRRPCVLALATVGAWRAIRRTCAETDSWSSAAAREEAAADCRGRRRCRETTAPRVFPEREEEEGELEEELEVMEED